MIMILATGCFREESTDEELLQHDRERLEESLNGIILDYYKFLKVSLRVMPVLDTTIEEHRKIRELNDKLFPGMFDNSTSTTYVAEVTNKKNTLQEATEFVSAYLALRKFARNHDEDEFPTLLEGQARLNGDSLKIMVNGEMVYIWPPLEGEAKESLQSLEHILFSAFMLIDRSQQFSESILLYECSKSNMETLPESDLKAVLQMIRGILFFDQDLLYLSEKEYSENLNWLYENPNEELPITSTIFFWAPFFTGEYVGRAVVVPHEAAYYALILTNHTLRAMSRLTMDREIDEERAMEDFEAIVKTAHEVGVQNEAVWSIEAYLYLHQEKSEETIVALKKLRDSELLSDDERKTIDEAIKYQEKREPGKALNGVYDKYFLNKIMIKYMYNKVKKQDWIKIMKELGIVQGDELVEINKGVSNLLEKVEEETSKEALKEKGKELKEQGEKLFKDLWD
ncbi:MAG: hypothetical protein COA57_11365 [Flavobacteriales bacterium]|nr:MAG: hypothetical protein COA57_11365 [Flavobacteriales bacterium]